MKQPVSAEARGDVLVAKEKKPEQGKNRIIRARQRAIGRELRRLFDEITREPVPEDFLELLRKIDDGGEGGGGDA